MPCAAIHKLEALHLQIEPGAMGHIMVFANHLFAGTKYKQTKDKEPMMRIALAMFLFESPKIGLYLPLPRSHKVFWLSAIYPLLGVVSIACRGQFGVLAINGRFLSHACMTTKKTCDFCYLTTFHFDT